MPHHRFKTLDEFRAIIEPFEHDDYYPANHRLPFVELLAASAIEVPYFNYAQFHKYAAILMECARPKAWMRNTSATGLTMYIVRSFFRMICATGSICISSR